MKSFTTFCLDGCLDLLALFCVVVELFLFCV